MNTVTVNQDLGFRILSFKISDLFKLECKLAIGHLNTGFVQLCGSRTFSAFLEWFRFRRGPSRTFLSICLSCFLLHLPTVAYLSAWRIIFYYKNNPSFLARKSVESEAKKPGNSENLN